MDLLIPNNWLKKFLETKATPAEIAKYLSLCGPSIEKTKKTEDGDYVYSIEVTTNRVDTASVLGIAREASAILPRFGIKARFKNYDLGFKNKYKFVKNAKYLDALVDPKLCPRFTAVLIKNVTIKDSPQEIKSFLEKVNVRPINNIVDVSNYIMHELGQPVHTFDYDKITDHKMILRESKKGESVTTLDGKTFKLTGGDIVIEDGEKRLIDLCGIMGGQNSAIDENSKNVLLFVQNYDQHKIRKTSMGLAQRSEAAVLFEKGLDSELISPAILAAIDLIEKISGGVSEKEIIDIYPNPYKEKKVATTLERLEQIIGIKLIKTDITKYLTDLGFKVIWKANNINVTVPSFRASDIEIPEDIAEEVARIYGYHNLPCVLMPGELPKQKVNSDFTFEKELKQILRLVGGIEIYSQSLVTKEMAGIGALRLKNPLGSDTEYLRTSLKPSLIASVQENSQILSTLHFFEVSNIYLPHQNNTKASINLPKENLILAGIIKNGKYRQNKGTVEYILDQLGIEYNSELKDGNDYLPNQRIVVYSNKVLLGEYGNLDNAFYYEFEIKKLMNAAKTTRKYIEPSKFPPQIEDITFQLPDKTYIGTVINSMKSVSQLINKVELKDIYENNYTFNIEYQDKNKTLTDSEVEEIRNKILIKIKKEFGGQIKG